MYPHWAELCRTNPAYRAKWEAQRDNQPLPQKPPQPHWIMCPYRGKSTATISAKVAGVGCGSTKTEVYQCGYFNEPVLKKSPARCLGAVAELVEGYTGRTCKECQVPSFALPIPTGGLTQDTARGIITGANEKHWACLGSLAIAAHEQRLGFAVADHGLSPMQRGELDRVGVRWIIHGEPDISRIKNDQRIPSEIRAWWKPWICLASPFRRSVWVDSDAAIVGSLAQLFTGNGMHISTQRIWQPDSANLYRKVVASVFGDEKYLDAVAVVNSGVFAWSEGEPLIERWCAWCQRLMKDAKLVAMCRVRDQAGLVMTLVDDQRQARTMPGLLPDQYNIPADYLGAGKSKNRKPIDLNPVVFLQTAKARHPEAIIVHWLGGFKPWSL